MTPDSLARLNDLRSRVVAADEAERAGDHDRARTLMPSDDEIIEALSAARADRSEALKKRSERAADKAAVAAFATMDLNDLFK